MVSGVLKDMFVRRGSMRYVAKMSAAISMIALACLLIATGSSGAGLRAPAGQDSATPAFVPFRQDWTNTSLITVNDNWSQVLAVEGYLGQNITTGIGVDPQTLLTTSTVANDLDVIANQTNPDTLVSGGVAEFEIANPVVALQASSTADAPYLIINLDTTGESAINVLYDLRDIDASVDNSVQPVALQYRVGNTGNFTNVPAGFVADASTGPSLATLVTEVSAQLGADADNQPLVQVRIITSNAAGNDEWIGVDNIVITGARSRTVNGTVTYGNAVPAATRFVSNVQMSAVGSPSFSVFTDAAGQYTLAGFGASEYTVTPDKTGGQNGALTSFDAAKVAQHAAGISLLTGNALLVADVSGGNGVTSFDAAEIARWVSGATTQVGSTGNWIFQPANRAYGPITSNVPGQDYSALLMGEVSGNWTNTTPPSPTPTPQLEVLYDKLGNAATGWGWSGQGGYTSTYEEALSTNYIVVTSFVGSVASPKRIRKIEVAGGARNTESGAPLTISYFNNRMWLGIWNGNAQSFWDAPLGGSLGRVQMPIPNLGSTTVPVAGSGGGAVYVFGWDNLDIPLPASLPLEMSLQFEGIQLGDVGFVKGSSIPGPNMLGASSDDGNFSIGQPMAIKITVSD
jgi:hypothetical protein